LRGLQSLMSAAVEDQMRGDVHVATPSAGVRGGAKNRILSLQVLRAVAAGAVVYDHAYNRVCILWSDAHPVVSQWFATKGIFGVDLFFLLSGYLMAHLHKDQFGRGRSGVFFQRRLLRIVPLYWALSGAALVLLHFAPALFANVRQVSWSWILGNFLFLPLPQPSGVMSHVIVVGWTLDYEMYFYVLFALSMIFRYGISWLFVFLIGSVIVGMWIVPVHPWPQLLTSPLLLEFLSGIGLAMLADRHSLPKEFGWPLIAFGTVLLTISSPVSSDFDRAWKLGAPCALLLLGSVTLGSDCRGFLGRVLVKMGDASYSIYLFQGFALTLIGRVAWRSGVGLLPPDLRVALLWIAGCGAGVVIWRFVESPLTERLKRGVLSRRMSAPARSV
jgi:exopolysaccharide production protein ExoZ